MLKGFVRFELVANGFIDEVLAKGFPCIPVLKKLLLLGGSLLKLGLLIGSLL